MEITATEFKAKCLAILDQVNRTGEVVMITKRGKVVAELRAPYGKKKRTHAAPGFAIGAMEITGDIMEPIDLEWEAMQ